MDHGASDRFPHARRGRLIAVFGPSGSGKNTLIERVKRSPQGLGLRQIPTVTTRAPRPDEVVGVHHYYWSAAEFQRSQDAQAFVENAENHGNRYGMLRETVETLTAGADGVCDVDIRGVRALRAAYPGDVARVFLKPPSLAVLRERIRRRGEISPEELARRLRRAEEELREIERADYDYLVLNDVLDAAVADLCRIVAQVRRYPAVPTNR